MTVTASVSMRPFSRRDARTKRSRTCARYQIAEKGGVYVLDEPTSGLHLADVEQRQTHLLHRLVDSGKSVIVIEHHQAVMAHFDWIIDLGPGASDDGDRVVFEGTPARLVATGSTVTGNNWPPASVDGGGEART